jgi:hypothetical protein
LAKDVAENRDGRVATPQILTAVNHTDALFGLIWARLYQKAAA